jgi:hypothetical protein
VLHGLLRIGCARRRRMCGRHPPTNPASKITSHPDQTVEYNPIGAEYARLLHDPNLPLERRHRILRRITRGAPGFLANQLADRYQVFPESPFFLADQFPVRYNFELDHPS